MVSPEHYINYHGQDWNNFKLWLQARFDTKVSLLIAEPSHDKSNQIRGAISFINEILALEKAQPPSRTP